MSGELGTFFFLDRNLLKLKYNALKKQSWNNSKWYSHVAGEHFHFYFRFRKNPAHPNKQNKFFITVDKLYLF